MDNLAQDNTSIERNFRKEIKKVQNYKTYEELTFDPDSSPEAWEHYKTYYSKSLNDNYDFGTLHFLNYYDPKRGMYGRKKGEEWYYNYLDIPMRKNGKVDTKYYNRLFIVSRDMESNNDDKEGITRFGPGLALGGDCDFNFKEEGRYNNRYLFKTIIGEDPELIGKLDYCCSMHHTVLNFSLMQKCGNMQKHKGYTRFDRLDTFISDLDEFFLGISEKVLDKASEVNKPELVQYLNGFKNVYDYMEKMYFISDKLFVNRLIDEGKMPIRNKYDVARYMQLAMDYWEMREKYFIRVANN